MRSLVWPSHEKRGARTTDRPLRASRLWYGGDYNPEQWPEEVWEQDAALMRAAGVTLVTVGVFSWAELEPEPGRFRFGWMDRVLGLLHEAGIGVCLATPTAAPPPWFGLAHPDALPVRADGTPVSHGSRDTYCVCAPAYREASARITRELAGRYAGHPALTLWHAHNEYGTWCHCDHVAAAFREWLRARHGTLAALNDAWTTAFWSQRYSAWEQVRPPRATQYLPNPAQVLDFRRFLSDAMLAHFRAQKAMLRELSPGVPVTTNFAFGSWVPVDPWRWADEVDLIALDHYPGDRDAAAEETAFAADLARGWAGGRPWLLMEQAAGVVYTGPRMLTKRPGEIALHSLSHIARGSAGAMFFQWRASRGGAELWHGGMVPHAGPDSRVHREVRALGELLPSLAGLRADGPVSVGARAAILWDAQSWWALEAPAFPSADLRYLDAVRQAHRVLWRGGVPVDFACPDHDLSSYDVVLVPCLYLVSDATAARLTAYVEGGGTLVVSFFSGVADEHARVRLGGYPGALRDLLGVRTEEFLPLDAPVPVHLLEPSPTSTTGTAWSERVELRGARPIATYGGDLDGLPAVTRHTHGAGQAFYLSTRLDDAAYAQILTAAGLPPTGVPPGVELIRREGGDRDWLFALNHTPAAQTITARGADVLSGTEIDGPLRLPPRGFAVLRTPPAPGSRDGHDPVTPQSGRGGATG
ncbi:beta-galactosidase [Sphaerisporangium aureirubrum]|uniref:Beta-galactosidase n=1 Tax=Sphaerisporangium aureirubrum TaxID=1544736 RepID=A0ABW1NAT3_9ACTN